MNRRLAAADAPSHDGAVAAWTVYILRAGDGSLYTGITTDLERRVAEHRAGPRGARYFRGRDVAAVVFREEGHTRATASRREAEIKGLSRERKLALIAAAGKARP